MYNNVCWFSRNKVLRRFIECFNEINFNKNNKIMFLDEQNEIHKELSDNQWIASQIYVLCRFYPAFKLIEY